MEKTNNPLSLGSAVYAAKRAADITFVLQNNNELSTARVLMQLNSVLEEYGENSKVNSTDLESLEAVGRQLLAVFSAPDIKKTADLLNDLLERYASKPRLSGHDGSFWHIHIDSNDHAPWDEWFATSSALALAILLAEKQRNPGGLCASRSCGRPFIDTGKGGGRNYCSPRCATRERVSAYRQRAA